MYVVKSRLVLVVTMVVAGILIFGNVEVSAQCGGSIPELAAECMQSVKIGGPKMNPTGGCCAAVRAANTTCVCEYVTPEIQKVISMEKAEYIARICGEIVLPGMKCGSYTVPSKGLI